ncbi:hypothetical protein BDW22DRAFT_1482844 [Trametopsis cervina]|nr:hypothetical protein BDW22DRAFT_1482844 [Trametopsis cervina]
MSPTAHAPSTAGIHTLVVLKRSLPIPITAFAGSIVGGVVIIGLMITILVVAYRKLLRPRKANVWRISGPLSVEHSEAREALMKLSHARQASNITVSSGGYTDAPQRRSVSERHPSGLPIWRVSAASSQTNSSLQGIVIEEKPEKPAAAVKMLAVNAHHRRSLDAETASLYSCVSAPLDYHEKLFSLPLMALDPNMPASAPAWISATPQSTVIKSFSGLPPPSSRGSPATRRLSSSGVSRAKLTRKHSDRVSTANPRTPQATHTPWSRRAVAHPPTQIHWLTQGAENASPPVVAPQPVADHSSLPSVTPLILPSVAPLNIRSKTTTRKDNHPSL